MNLLVDGRVFGLRETLGFSGVSGEADLAEAWDALPGTTALVDLDLNRQAEVVDERDLRRADVITSDSVLYRNWNIGFKWNDGDYDIDYWYPQGITGSFDAVGGDGLWGRESDSPLDREEPQGNSLPTKARHLLLASWYCKDYDEPNPPKGVRISVVDVTSFRDPEIKYRHVLLVIPRLDGGGVNFSECLAEDGDSVHAGGIAWYGRFLFVADGYSLRVFDLLRIKEVAGSDDDFCGRSSSGVYSARGYRYVCPQVAQYDAIENEYGQRVWFSFCAIDRSTDPHRMVGGKWVESDPGSEAMLTWWELNSTTGLLRTSTMRGSSVGLEPVGGDAFRVRRRMAESVVTMTTGQERMQGAVSQDNRVWVSSGGGGYLWFQDTDESFYSVDEHEWAKGCEDLAYSAHYDNLWCLTEFPSQRFVFAIQGSTVS